MCYDEVIRLTERWWLTGKGTEAYLLQSCSSASLIEQKMLALSTTHFGSNAEQIQKLRKAFISSRNNRIFVNELRMMPNVSS